MSPFLLRTSVKFIAPIQLALALYFLLRGHNEPGGGFIGGLAAASAVLLYGLSFGIQEVESKLPVSWFSFALFGLSLAVFSAFISVFVNQPFFTGIWGPELYAPLVGKLKLGTVLLFDIGVFCLVMGFGVGLGFTFFAKEAER
ncbi:MAG: Na(+)/H(+) antiporter subunit B [Candidatus Omnitrophica bacterium]|nr:Na(+)/H(+) antiporter subunit B [Candidatus Omnitrophota bacterium]